MTDGKMACIEVNDMDKLSYEIFSILESKFLFGYDDQKLWIPKQIAEPNNGVLAVADGGDGVKNQRGKICILSIDGGGMRSIILGKTLSYLESALKKKSGNPDARIADYFDVAAGAGTGGVFTAMLFAADGRNRPIFHADDTWKFLAAEGGKFYATGRERGGLLTRIFGRNGGRTGSSLQKVMQEAFEDRRTGRFLTLKDTVKPVLIPCYDLASTAPFLFSRADAVESDSYDFNLWEVCLATSAEPGATGPVHMTSVDGLNRCLAVDGGLAMSNPTAAAITHVLHNKQEFPFVRGVEDILVISLGVSSQLLEGSWDYDNIKKWKGRDWARPLTRVSGDCSAELVDHAVAMAFGKNYRQNYVRIQANGPIFCGFGANVDTDSSPTNVNMLIGAADEMLKQKSVESILFGGKTIGEQSNMEKLDWFAEQLVLEHQRRCHSISPTVALKQSTPT